MYSTLAEEQAPYNEYKSSLTCFVPATSNVPLFIHNGVKLPGSIAFLIREFLARLDEAAATLQQQVMWAHETKELLNSLSAAILPIVHSLKELVFDHQRVTINSDRRFRAYHSYFNIFQLASMDALELACEDARITYWIFQEIKDIRMDECEVHHFIKATRLRWEVLLKVIADNMNVDEELAPVLKYVDGSVGDAMAFDCRKTAAFFRWFIAHYAFAINCINARHHLDISMQQFDAGLYEEAALSVTRAGSLLRSCSTSMVLGCSIPSGIYQDVIRPSMGLGFSGNDNPEWSAFAETKKQMIKKLGASHNPVIIKALKGFLEAYLQDVEIHVGVAARLVGNKSSLATEEINAFAAEGSKIERSVTVDLRNLHYMRLKEFEFLQVYPIVNKLFSKDH